MEEEVNNQLEMYERQMAEHITGIVFHLRDLLKTRSKDFVLFRLDEIAKETEMDDTLKQCIVKAIDEPDKPFSIQFKRKVK